MTGVTRNSTGNRIKAWQLVAYGQAVMPLAVVGLPLAIYIPPFYSQNLGLDLAAIGFILMAARLGDVFIDLAVGRLSDLTRGRWGRRRPWIVAGVPLMMISSVMLFMPERFGQTVTSGYLLTWIALIYLGFTLISVPYAAWGVELSTDYHERNRIAGVREMFLLAGLFLAVTVPILGGYRGGTGSAANQMAFHAMGLLGGLIVVLVPLCILLLMRYVPDATAESPSRISLRQGLQIITRNGPLRVLLVTIMLSSLARSVNASVALLFFTHIAQLTESQPALIFGGFAAGIVGAPFWVRLGGRLEKHKAVAIAGTMAVIAHGCVPLLVYGLRSSHVEMIVGLFAATIVEGFCAAAPAVLGASMLADVVDLDTLRSGERRTGLLSALFAMVRKAFEAAGAGIALPPLAWLSFNPTSMTNSASANFALVAMFSVVPLALWGASIWVISRYSLTREYQRQVRAELAVKFGDGGRPANVSALTELSTLAVRHRDS